MLPQPGDVIGGKYRIERKLGQGGMGVVFAATDVTLKRPVAIKQLLPSLHSDVDCVARFLREARAAVALTSEHTVRVFDVGESSGVPFMVMEYLSGKDLGGVVTAEGRLPCDRAVGYMLQAIEGIAEAHVAGIIHRDLKPQNLFLTTATDGSARVKVLDFGLAKAPVGDGERALTGTAAVMGTPEYMSPEQTRGSRDVDTRTDVWALGVCLYELVTGQVPFSALNIPDIIVKLLTTAPPPPHVIFEDIPVGLSRVILRCLEKDAKARFADVGALASALQPFAPPNAAGASERVRRVLARSPRAALQEDDPTLPIGAARDEQGETKTEAIYDSAPERKKKRIFVSAALGAVVLAATAGTVIANRHRGQVDGRSQSVAPPDSSPPTAEPSASAVASTAAAVSAAASAPEAKPSPRAGARPSGPKKPPPAPPPPPSTAKPPSAVY